MSKNLFLSIFFLSILLILTQNHQLYSMYEMHTIHYNQDKYSKKSSIKTDTPQLLRTIIFSKHGKLVKMLKEQTINPNIPILNHAQKRKIQYPLEIAISYKNIKAIIILLEHGANPILTDIIEKAIHTQNIQSIGFLLAKAKENDLYNCLEKELERYTVYITKYIQKSSKTSFIDALLWDMLKGKNLKYPKFTFPKKSTTKNNKLDNNNIKEKFKEMVNLIRFQKNKKDKKIEKKIEEIEEKIFTIRDKNKKYLIHYIAEYLPSLLALVVKRNIDINRLDSYRNTPAHIIMQYIINLKNGGLLFQIKIKNPNKAIKKIYTLLIKIFTLLVKNKANLCIKPLDKKTLKPKESLWEIATEYPDILQILLANGDLNCCNPENNNTVVHQLLSCQSTTNSNKNPVAIKKILTKILPKLNAKQVNKCNLSGLTALHLATIYKNTQIIELLMEKTKANPAKKGFLNMSPKDILESLYRNNKIIPSRYKAIKKIFTLTRHKKIPHSMNSRQQGNIKET